MIATKAIILIHSLYISLFGLSIVFV